MRGLKDAFRMFSEIILLNTLFLITVLLGVFIPAGAGLKAMFTVSRHIIDRDRATYVAREYWDALKDGFWRATLLWLMFAAAGFLFYVTHRIGIADGHILLMSTTLVAMVLLSMYAIYVFAVMARFQSDSIGGLLKNAFLMMASSPWALFKVAGSVAFAMLLFSWFTGTVLFSLAVVAVLVTHHLNRLFTPYLTRLNRQRDDSHA